MRACVRVCVCFFLPSLRRSLFEWNECLEETRSEDRGKNSGARCSLICRLKALLEKLMDPLTPCAWNVTQVEKFFVSKIVAFPRFQVYIQVKQYRRRIIVYGSVTRYGPQSVSARASG